MTTLILDGYIVKEGADDGEMFYYSAKPYSVLKESGEEFSCRYDKDVCFGIDLPIKNLLNVDSPTGCRITIELDK